MHHARTRQSLAAYPTSWKPTTKTSVRCMTLVHAASGWKQIVKRTFIGEEVDTADGLLDLKALLQFARLDIPEADRLVVRATYQPLPYRCERVNDINSK